MVSAVISLLVFLLAYWVAREMGREKEKRWKKAEEEEKKKKKRRRRDKADDEGAKRRTGYGDA